METDRFIQRLSLGPLFDENGNIKYVIGYGTDITKRVVAEEENVRLSLVARNTNNGVLMLNKNREVTWANAEKFLGRSGYVLSDFLGLEYIQVAKKLRSRGDIHVVKKAMDNEDVTSIEILRKSKTGKTYWVDLNVQPLYNDDNQLSGFHDEVMFDITDRKKMRRPLQIWNTNLEKMVEEERPQKY